MATVKYKCPKKYDNFTLYGYNAVTGVDNPFFKTDDVIIAISIETDPLLYLDDTDIVLVKTNLKDFEYHTKLLSIYKDYITLSPLSKMFEHDTITVHKNDAN